MKKYLNLFFISLSVFFVFCFANVFAQEADKMKEGLSLYYARHYVDAAEVFKSILETEKGNSMAMMYLMSCAQNTKKIDSYLSEYEEKALSNPKDPYIKCYLGFMYFGKSILEHDDVFEEATNMFQEALKLDSNLALAYNGMGTVYFQKRLIPRSRSYFSKAVKIDPNDTMSIERIGDIYLNDDKNYGAAKSYFEEIISLYPTYPDAYFYYACACQAEGDYKTAIEYYKKCAELDPLGITQGYYAPVRLGDIYYKDIRDYSTAVDYYEKALDINPKNPYAKKMIEKAKNPSEVNKEEKKEEENPKVKKNIKDKIKLDKDEDKEEKDKDQEKE